MQHLVRMAYLHSYANGDDQLHVIDVIVRDNTADGQEA